MVIIMVLELRLLSFQLVEHLLIGLRQAGSLTGAVPFILSGGRGRTAGCYRMALGIDRR
jgi:hypothetical protein